MWLFIGSITIPLALVVLFSFAKRSQKGMNTWVWFVMAPLEQFFGRIWSICSFSVAEVLAAIFLTWCVVWLIRSIVLAIRKKALLLFLRHLLAFVSVWLWLWAGLCWFWNAAYYIPAFAQREGLTTEFYSLDELATVTEHFAQKAAVLATQVPRDENGHFSASLSDCFAQGPDIYQNITTEFPSLDIYSVQAKPLLCSKLQSIMGFTGIYFPFTGEANVNVDAPACLVPATIGHEMAHQRMVSSELEANFVGIAACTSCDNVVFQYSGYLMGLIHLCNALYASSPDTWYVITERTFNQELAQDWNDNNDYWDALKSPVEETAGDVYDSFLKSNHQEMGIRSYGACVDLLVSYFTSKM